MLLRTLFQGAIAPVLGIAALTFAGGVSAASLSIPPGETLGVAQAIAPSAANSGPGMYLIQLRAEPAAVIYRQVTGGVANPTPATLNLARQQTRARVAQIESAQQRVLGQLPAAAPSARVLYRASKALNGIVIEADSVTVERLQKLPGVKAVLPVVPEYPSTSTSVPFLEAEAVWDAAGFGATGDGVSIGIIDSGIDYQHPDLGGSGLLADYQANNRTIISETGPAAFPTGRVVGGIDLVGDGYPGTTAAPVPAVSDPDPMDCGGHGTHVATIAAGGGVNTDGTPYAGPWNASTNFGALRIGPGTAPQADLYAIRVFGCDGSTGFAAAAIDWAMDPNDDGDLSDHLDIVNMSLGSSFGGLSSSTTIAADNASDAGMVMVISAGNSGDTFSITGSPSVSTRAISVANIADSGVVGTSLRVNSTPVVAGTYIAANSAISPAVQPAPSGQTSDLVLVDGNHATALPFEGCGTALDNAAAVAGKFAFVRRGVCSFNIKVENAQNAGALGVVLYDNAVGEPAPIVMGGTYTAGFTPTIPIISTNNATGVAIHNAITAGDTINVSLIAADASRTIAFSSSRGPRYEDLAPKPDVSAPGTSISAAQTGITCLTGGGCITPDPDGVIEGGQIMTISGTSMAAPHVAGIAALLRQVEPTRSVEEIKASIMNGALQDVFLGAGNTGGRISTSRAGSGSANALNAAALEVLAFNADSSGAVSLGFDPEIVGSATQTRKLRLVNHGNTVLSLDLAFDTIRDVPGVGFALPAGGATTIPAQSSVVIEVQLSATASAMTHPRDPTMSPTQSPAAPAAAAGAQGRHWLAEESALLVLSSGGSPLARVPVYVAPRAAAQMQAPSVIDTVGAATGSVPLTLTGTGLCSGTLVGTACSVPEQGVLSIFTGFELQAFSSRNTAIPDHNDIRYVGAATESNGAGSVRHLFAIGTHGVRQTAYAGSFQVEIDLNNDSVADRTLFNGDTGTVAARLFGSQTSGQDVNFMYVFIPPGSVSTVGHTELFNPRTIDMRLYGTDVAFLSANRATLGLAADTTTFRYRVSTCRAGSPLCSVIQPSARADLTGWIAWNPAARGITFTPSFLGDDQPGAAPTLNWNTANLAANGSLGALLLHHHNAIGTTQQVITLANTNVDVANDAADVSVALSVNNPAPNLGQNVTYTLSTQHAGPNSPTDILATFVLPDGLAYVSDTSGGAYDPITGVWTVAGAASGVVSTINVIATVEKSGPIEVSLDAMGSFVDPSHLNNHAEVAISSANSADISVVIVRNASPITAGGSVNYTVTLSNAGPETAYSVDVVHDLASLGLTPTASSVSAGSYNNATRTWTLASVASGENETLQLSYTLTQAGTFTHNVTATHDDNDPSVPNADSVDVVVSAGAVDQLVIVAGNPQSALVSTIFATDLAVRAEDSFDNPVVGAQVSFIPPATGASGAFAGPTPVLTNAAGIATAPDFTANAIAGSYFVAASSGSQSVNFGLENLRYATSTTLAAVPASLNLGQSVTLTATVLDDLAAPLTTGSVNFSVGATPLCTAVALSASGTAECVTSFATAGNVTVRADFVQTSSHSASFDDEIVTVTRLVANVAVTVQPTPVLPSGAITLLAALSGAAAAPTGTVDFLINGATICNAVPVVGGNAQCNTTASATVGDYPVVVNYTGDATYLPGTGNAQVQVRTISIFASGFEN